MFVPEPTLPVSALIRSGGDTTSSCTVPPCGAFTLPTGALRSPHRRCEPCTSSRQNFRFHQYRRKLLARLRASLFAHLYLSLGRCTHSRTQTPFPQNRFSKSPLP